MRMLILNFAFLILPAVPAVAELTVCENTMVGVHSVQSDDAQIACEAVKQALVLFEQCNIPYPPRQLRIDIVDELEPGCVALYHCHEDWIEVLTPFVMDVRRSPDGVFAFMAIDEYFQSVIVHELAHSAFDAVPCPFETCVVADEYVAYAMQIMSMQPDARRSFEDASGLGRKVSRDELNAMTLFMAPDLFARKTWAHLSQRSDRCGFIGKIMDGIVVLDRERF